MSPILKASAVTFIFTAVGLWALLFRAPVTDILWAHLLVYAVLLFNTFLSVRFYSALQPNDIPNAFIDAFLVLAYVALGLSLGYALDFAVAALFLFITAPAKYALMLNKIPYTALLQKKILIDLAGAFACAALLTATLAGYDFVAAWTFAIVFALMNIHLLLINPMYKL